MDKLVKMFAMQETINDNVFDKNNIFDVESGMILKSNFFAIEIEELRLGPNDLPNQWLMRFSKAMREELNELDDELLWKWWSKDELDIQNIRVELIDILHFLVSACQAAGMSADDVFRIYEQKHNVNMNRQDSGYSKQSKDENDNRGIL